MTLFSILFLLKQVLAGDSHSPLVQRNASCSSNIHYLLVYLKENKKSILAVIANRLKFFSSSHKLLVSLFHLQKNQTQKWVFFRCIHANRSTLKIILLHLLKSSCLSQNMNGIENKEVFLISTRSHLYLWKSSWIQFIPRDCLRCSLSNRLLSAALFMPEFTACATLSRSCGVRDTPMKIKLNRSRALQHPTERLSPPAGQVFIKGNQYSKTLCNLDQTPSTSSSRGDDLHEMELQL